jgi:hypothetical protein
MQINVGDLVRLIKSNRMGVVIEIFGDLDPENPWVRVAFSEPKQSYQWCRGNGLRVVKKEGAKT